MTKATQSAIACHDACSEILNHLHKVQKNMLSGALNPLELTLDSLFRLSAFTTASLDRLLNHHHDTLSFYLPYLGAGVRSSRAMSAAARPRIETRRVVVVTGGTGGIGTEICKRLYADGHRVVATFLAAEADRAAAWREKHREAGFDIDIIECDVTDFSACRKMGRTLERKYGHVDILVNGAGITRDATLRKMDLENWHAVLDTNLDSVFNVTRNLINGMIRRRYGRIINISSVNGQKGQFGQTNYSAAKAGMIGFSKSLALELAGSGITVNSICPGYVETSMVEAIPEDIRNSIISRIPLGRLADPSEIADAVSYLAAEKSGYITGSEISINGGLYTG